MINLIPKNKNAVGMADLEVFRSDLERALISLDRDMAQQIINKAASTGSPVEIAGELISRSLKSIGDKWEKGTLSLSQVYISGLICEQIIDTILPPSSPVRKNQPKMAIAVFEDYHLLGKRIIYSVLRASGFELIDLGGGQDVTSLCEIIEKKKIKILLLSVLMLPSALRIKKLKEKLAGSGIKIIVGGAPFRFDEELWKEVGADAYGKDSSEAIDLVTKLMAETL
ncbi:MAG: cobalamin-dependent protein [Bacteroidales bacterium]|nr:cobalamin-dependent protein [Bacteroidales bacterium]